MGKRKGNLSCSRGSSIKQSREYASLFPRDLLNDCICSFALPPEHHEESVLPTWKKLLGETVLTDQLLISSFYKEPVTDERPHFTLMLLAFLICHSQPVSPHTMHNKVVTKPMLSVVELIRDEHTGHMLESLSQQTVLACQGPCHWLPSLAVRHAPM